jgi:tetratricopeptide (TPR) repeat protein
VRYTLGEAYRQISWQGYDGYEQSAEEAMRHYRLAAEINPYDPYPVIRTGMCLDWLGRRDEALSFFEAARDLDPNNYYLSILRGWHHIETGEYREAQKWLLRSLQQKNWPNDQARRFYYKARRLQRLEAKQVEQPG